MRLLSSFFIAVGLIIVTLGVGYLAYIVLFTNELTPFWNATTWLVSSILVVWAFTYSMVSDI